MLRAAALVPRQPGYLGIAVGTGLLAFILSAIAVLSPASALATACGLLFLAIIFVSFEFGVALFIGFTFFSTLPALGGNITGVKLLGAALTASWILTLVIQRRRVPMLVREHPLVSYALLAFLGWGAASILWADDQGLAISNLMRLIQGVVLVFIVFSAVRDTKRMRWMLWAYAIGASGATLAGIVGIAGEAILRTENVSGGLSEISAALIPAVWICAFLGMTTDNSLHRLLLGAMGVLSALGVVLTGSRGSLLGLVVSLAVALLLAGPARPRVIALVLIVSALAVGYYVFAAPPQATGRLTGQTDERGSGRTGIWAVATDIAKDHPVAGVGLGNVTVVEKRAIVTADVTLLGREQTLVLNGIVVLNTYLELLAELGLIGLGLFAIAVLSVLTQATSALRWFVRTGYREEELLVRGLLVAAAGAFVAYIFFSAQYEKSLWLLLGLLVSATNLRSDHALAFRPEAAADLSASRRPLAPGQIPTALYP